MGTRTCKGAARQDGGSVELCRADTTRAKRDSQVLQQVRAQRAMRAQARPHDASVLRHACNQGEASKGNTRHGGAAR